jgi:nitronate monooxygenase
MAGVSTPAMAAAVSQAGALGSIGIGATDASGARKMMLEVGLPQPDRVRALKDAGCFLIASATNLREAEAGVQAGIHAIVAQGWEAGGHRGTFNPDAPDDRLGTVALTRLLLKRTDVPIIAAGGIMDGQGIRAMLELGATAAQLGTAFVGCPESAADEGYPAALFSEAAEHTTMTRAISGRPARCLANAFTRLADGLDTSPPDYPVAYDAGKALNAAAKAAGNHSFGAQWAGQGAPLARALPAAKLVAALVEEMAALPQVHREQPDYSGTTQLYPYE